MEILTENRKIGMFLTGFGVFFLFFGIMLLGDRALLALGNLLFVSGIIFLIGIQNTGRFFFRKSKLRGTTCFLLGIILVLVKWPITGFFVEVFGIINLFGNFFPMILTVLKEIPLIGRILSIPVIDNWPTIGFIVEVLGNINLFGNFFPMILTVLKEIPLVGRILSVPVLDNFLNRLLGAKLPS